MQLASFYMVFVVVLFLKINRIQSKNGVFTSDKNNVYYIEETHNFSWFEALVSCMKMNMTLVTIDTSEKDIEINTLVQKNFGGRPNLWTGGIRTSNGEFVWLATGKKFTYTNWGGSNPDFHNNNEYCVHTGYYESVNWNDLDCSNRRGYVCERNPKETQEQLQKQQELQEKQILLEKLQRELNNVRDTLQQQKQQQDMEKQLKQEIISHEILKENLQQQLKTVKNTLEQEKQQHEDLKKQLEEEMNKHQLQLEEEIEKQDKLKEELKRINDILNQEKELQKDTEKPLSQGMDKHKMQLKQTLLNCESLEENIKRKIKEQENLQEELKSIKDTLNNVRQDHQDLQNQLKQEMDKHQLQLRREVLKCEMLEKSLQREIRKQQNLQPFKDEEMPQNDCNNKKYRDIVLHFH